MDRRRLNEKYENIRTSIELFEILEEAEDDVRNNRVATIAATFDDLRKSCSGDGEGSFSVE